MRVLDLFSGIGGFSLGLERAGMRTVAFCEIDPYCQAVLRKHWPDVPVFGDVRTLTAAKLAANGIFPLADTDSEPIRSDGCVSVVETAGGMQGEAEQRQRLRSDVTAGCRSFDVICGGFPCQDISVAGKGAGLDGARSGLWSEYARIIGEVRPRYAIVENVAALLGRGLSRVLGDLAALGYDAEWHCISAAAVGAPHRRDRVWIVAYGGSNRGRGSNNQHTFRRSVAGNCGEDVAYPDREVMERQWLASRILQERDSISRAGWWLTESDVGRVAHGVPARVDRLRALGNAVVPQIAEIIGRAIMR